MKEKIGKLKVKDYVVCLNVTAPPIKHLTLSKIYIIHTCYSRNSEAFFKIKNDIYLEDKVLCAFFAYRFRKATKKEIKDNIVDIVHRKLKDAI